MLIIPFLGAGQYTKLLKKIRRMPSLSSRRSPPHPETNAKQHQHLFLFFRKPCTRSWTAPALVSGAKTHTHTHTHKHPADRFLGRTPLFTFVSPRRTRRSASQSHSHHRTTAKTHTHILQTSSRIRTPFSHPPNPRRTRLSAPSRYTKNPSDICAPASCARSV